MNNDPFHHFSQLPLELRRLIWVHCLPYRIVEKDFPDFFFDGYETQACFSERTTKKNQPPTTAFVNSESRQVALEHGRWLESVDEYCMKSLWVQPRRDVLHYNWSRVFYAVQGGDRNTLSSANEFLKQAKDLGMRPSVVGELIHGFSMKAVLDDAYPPESPREFHFNPSYIPVILYHYRQVDNVREDHDVRDIVEILPWTKDQNSWLDIAMAGVSLHIAEEAALQSGLFGLLGDAPVQMVDINNKAQIREFEALYRDHTLQEKSLVQRLFEVL